MIKTSPWNYWNNVLKSPKTILAPMVDGSELAFRLLCKKYGCDMGYSPMYHAGLFSKLGTYRNTNFQTCEEDDPLIVQFCGNNTEYLIKASKFIDDKVKGIDLNFGCPQNIAKRGNYGAFLLSNPDLMEHIISTMVNSDIKCPISCKIRLVEKEDLQKTVNLIKRLELAGINMIAVHGRTINNRGVLTGPCDWDSLKILKERSSIPFIANGGISHYEDIKKCLEYTRADAVMVAESILENPWLFQGYKYPNKRKNKPSQFEVAEEYLNLCALYPPPNNGIIRTHLYRIFHTIFTLPGAHVYRDYVNNSNNIEDYHNFLRNLKSFYYSKFMKDMGNYQYEIPEVGFWYIRHRIDKLEQTVTKNLISIYDFKRIELPAILKLNEQDMSRISASNNSEVHMNYNISSLFE